MGQVCANQAVYRRVIALYQDGYTIRQLEQHFQIPRSTLHYQVVKVLGKGARKRQSGLLSVLQEYEGLPGVAEWIQRNKARLCRADLDGDRTLLTSRQESALTYRETGHGGWLEDYDLDSVRGIGTSCIGDEVWRA